MNIAMIPARMGSQRLANKNLLPLRGEPLIVHAIRKCRDSGLFDEVWVNSEHPAFGELAAREHVRFHRRPEALAGHDATSEAFVLEFLESHDCRFLFQVHSVAPLMTVTDLRGFVAAMMRDECDVLFAVTDEPLEAFCRGEPVNFTLDLKTNSQELEPVRRITWSATAWRRSSYLAAAQAGRCATYAGRIQLATVSRLAGHIIKTAEDFAIAEALFDLVQAEARLARPQPRAAAG